MTQNANITTQSSSVNPVLAAWRDKKTRSIIFQVLAILGVAFTIYYLANNVITKYEELDKPFGFDFLSSTSGYDISFHLIPYSSQSTHADAAYVGILNTLNVAFWGLVAATILGFSMGVMRLSKNVLLSKMVYSWIELTRNVPLLLQILLWYGVFVNILPHPKNPVQFNEMIFLSNRGLNIPRPQFDSVAIFTLLAFIAGIIFTIVYKRRAKKLQEATGDTRPVLLYGLLAIIVAPIAVFLISGVPVNWEIAEMERFNLKGGMRLPPEFVSIWLALSVYTASFIAETVRAGIQAVSKGQTEAAGALGLRQNRIINLVVLPQAFRIIIPPLSSQYLNLVKNSSLAIAVGYQDIVATIGGTTLNQTGREMECMMIVMGLYLSFSLTISVIMNWYNKSVALVER